MYRTTLGVDGMMCGMCECHVRDAVQKALERQLIDAKSIKASASHKEVVVISERPIEERLLRSAVESIGYGATHFRSEIHQKKGLVATLASIFRRS